MFGSVPKMSFQRSQSSLLKIERSISCKTVGNSPPENTVLDEKSNFFHDYWVLHAIQQPNLNFPFNKPLFVFQPNQIVVEI